MEKEDLSGEVVLNQHVFVHFVLELGFIYTIGLVGY